MPILSWVADFRLSGYPEWLVGHYVSLKPYHFPNILHESFLIVALGIVLSSRLAVCSSRSLKTSRQKVASNEASRVKGCASTKYCIVYVQRSLCFINSPRLLPPSTTVLLRRVEHCTILWGSETVSLRISVKLNCSLYAFSNAWVTYVNRHFCWFVVVGPPAKVFGLRHILLGMETYNLWEFWSGRK